MNLHVDVERVLAAHDTVRSELLAERTLGGQWVGELSSSPLATATAVSALTLAHAVRPEERHAKGAANGQINADHIVQGDLSELIVESLHWLAQHQNADGGWGDTDRDRSNPVATMLVQAAFRLTGVPAKYAGLTERAEQFVEAQGDLAGFEAAVRQRQNHARADASKFGAGRFTALASGPRPALRAGLPAAALVSALAAARCELRNPSPGRHRPT